MTNLSVYFKSVRIRKIVTKGFLIYLALPASGQNLNHDRVLDLVTAVSAAQANDPWLSGNQHSQDAVESLSVAAGSLPDPRISVEFANLAVDTLDFDQEDMSQLKVGVTQVFPRGDSLALRKKQLELIGSRYPYQRETRKGQVGVTTVQLWFDAYETQESIAIIESSRALFEQLADLAQASYSSALGRIRQHDIVRAQLELTRLEDRLTVLKRRNQTNLHRLSEQVNNAFLDEYDDKSLAGNSETTSLPRLPRKMPQIEMHNSNLFTSRADVTPQRLFAYFRDHPALAAIEKNIKASETGIDLAEQKYKPEWGVNASYGYRGEDSFGKDRSDLISVAVSFDLLLFASKRLDKEVQSALSRTESIKAEKWLLLRKLVGSFETNRASLLWLSQRQELYRSELLPQMHEQAEASLTAYTNDDGDFAEVVRARIAELNASIDALKIDVERQKTIAQLNYLFIKKAKNLIATRHHPIAIAGEVK